MRYRTLLILLTSLINLTFLLLPTFLLAETVNEETADKDAPLSSSISLSLGTDSFKNKSRQLQLNIELGNFQQISAGYGDLISSSPTLNTKQYYFSLASNPYKQWSGSIEYSKWGKEKKLEIDSLQPSLFANLENWSFSLSPQANIVWLYANNGKVYDIKSKGLSASAIYYGFDSYFFGVNALQNKVTDNIRILENPALREIALSRISASAQLLISGLEKEQQGLSAGRYFYWGSLEIDWTKSSAALVDYQTDTLSLIVDYQLTKLLNLNVIATRQTAKGDNEALQAIDLGISAYW